MLIMNLGLLGGFLGAFPFHPDPIVSSTGKSLCRWKHRRRTRRRGRRRARTRTRSGRRKRGTKREKISWFVLQRRLNYQSIGKFRVAGISAASFTVCPSSEYQFPSPARNFISIPCHNCYIAHCLGFSAEIPRHSPHNSTIASRFCPNLSIGNPPIDSWSTRCWNGS